MSNLKIIVYQRLTPNLAADWLDLWQRSEFATPFNHPAWLRVTREADKFSELRILAGYAAGKLRAVLPLVRSRRFGIGVWTTPGNPFFSEKSTFLIEVEDVSLLNTILLAALNTGNLYLPEIDERLVDLVLRDNPGILAAVASVNPYLHLHLYPFRSLSKKNRSRLRNIIRRNRKQLRFVHHREDLERHFRTLVDLESRSRKGQTGKTVFDRPAAKRLFRSFIRHCREFVAIDMIYYGGKPIVYNLGLRFKKTYLTYQTAFLNEYRTLAPGKLLLCYLFLHLRKDGFWICDFARGYHHLKQEFTGDYRLQYDLSWSANPAVRVWWLLINATRRLRQRLLRPQDTDDHRFLFRRKQLQPERIMQFGANPL